MTTPAGPLAGVRVLELAGLGALPFGTLKLADMGADVIRVHRVGDVPAAPPASHHSEWDRGRRSMAIDLKQPDGVELLLTLA
ncbi:MAG TPA: CoA transferase, partial [Acidimicrobiia bacterium]